MEKNKNHQILSNYNNLNEQEQNSIQGFGAIDAMRQVLPLELTKIWGRSRNNIDKYELESVYRYFERTVKDWYD